MMSSLSTGGPRVSALIVLINSQNHRHFSYGGGGVELVFSPCYLSGGPSIDVVECVQSHHVIMHVID